MLLSLCATEERGGPVFRLPRPHEIHQKVHKNAHKKAHQMAAGSFLSARQSAEKLPERAMRVPGVFLLPATGLEPVRSFLTTGF